MSEAHKHRARIFLHRGDLVQARAAWEAAVEEDRSTHDLRELSNSLGNLGNACALCEDFDAAERCYREAMDLLRTLNDHRALGILYNNLALEEAREQHWKEAVESFGQALTYHRMVGNEEGLAVTYSQMGQCFLEQGDLENAERC